MTRHVELSPRAKLQLYETALWWAEHHSTEQAVRWMDGFNTAFQSLAENAERWALAVEADALGLEIRTMLYGLGRKKTHRAVFHIRENVVIVVAIRHLAQKPLTVEDV